MRKGSKKTTRHNALFLGNIYLLFTQLFQWPVDTATDQVIGDSSSGINE